MRDADDTPHNMVLDARWVRDKKGKPRLVEDAVDRTTWLERRKEPKGWRNGAKVRS